MTGRSRWSSIRSGTSTGCWTWRRRGRLGEVPDGELWVHCQAGYRASVAASILDAAGHAVVVVDDDYSRAAGAGLPLVPGSPIAAVA
jgi:rhodanese-related sulfurtransferase